MDAVDRHILDILGENGRISFSDLGREVGLSINAAAARVRRLESSGVILGYRAVLADDHDNLASGIEAFVDVRLQPDRDSDAFLAWAKSQANVVEAAHVTGPYDYHLHVRLSDTAALDQFLRVLKKTAGAAQTQTRLALR